MIPQGKPDCTEEQGDTTSRQDGGTISCQGNYMQLLEGEKSLRGPKVSSSPNSKGGLFTYLFVSKNTCTPDAAFQKGIELLKTLMTTGNVVFSASHSDSERAQRRHESSFTSPLSPFKKPCLQGRSSLSLGDHVGKGWGALQWITRARPPLGGNRD